jgi:hypothetical protein
VKRDNGLKRRFIRPLHTNQNFFSPVVGKSLGNMEVHGHGVMRRVMSMNMPGISITGAHHLQSSLLETRRV